MDHFLNNTPVFNSAKVKKMYAVQMIDIEDSTESFVTVFADSEEDARTQRMPWQRPTGVVFEVVC